MRNPTQLHDAALAIIADAPTSTLQIVAGELADVITATAGLVAELPDASSVKPIHTRYANSTKHNRETKLTVGAAQVLALTSLIS